MLNTETYMFFVSVQRAQAISEAITSTIVCVRLLLDIVLSVHLCYGYIMYFEMLSVLPFFQKKVFLQEELLEQLQVVLQLPIEIPGLCGGGIKYITRSWDGTKLRTSGLDSTTCFLYAKDELLQLVILVTNSCLGKVENMYIGCVYSDWSRRLTCSQFYYNYLHFYLFHHELTI